MGMALDPECGDQMGRTYADMCIGMWEILFEREGLPDGIWFFEDMGFKNRPFMSPEMYRELVMPFHRRTIDFAHAHGLPVIMHSCGFVEPLLPGVVDAGFDCLPAMEVTAGMALQRSRRDGIRRELESKIPAVMRNNGFILHSDHSIPESAEYDTYRYFQDVGLKLGTYR